MSYLSLAEPGTGLGGVGPQILWLNGRGLEGHGRSPRGGSEKLWNQIRAIGEAGQAQAWGPREGRAGFKALLHRLRQSFLVKQQRLDAPVFQFWYLVANDLRQHLRELHTEGFIHKGVETDLEKTINHLQEMGVCEVGDRETNQ